MVNTEVHIVALKSSDAAKAAAEARKYSKKKNLSSLND